MVDRVKAKAKFADLERLVGFSGLFDVSDALEVVIVKLRVVVG
jgi:hypothetical protein